MRTHKANKVCVIKPNVRKLRLAAAVIAGLSTAYANAQSGSIGVLEEIVVTGTKRDVDVQDVPISISTITEADLSRSQFNDIRALGAKAPGLVLSNPAGFNAAGGGMRGTGTNIILVTQDAPVSFLIDEFALTHVSSQFLNMFDMQQVEVYRGPQGTLFGRNATGGVISFTTKKPVLGETSAEVEATYGQHDNVGSGNYNSLKGALNLPLGETLAFRLAAIYDQDDGYYQNSKQTATFPNNVPLWDAFGIAPGTPLPPEINPNVLGDGSQLGGKDVLAVKGKLLWEPTDNFSANLVYEYLKDRSDSPPGINESTESDLLTLLGFPGIGLAGQRNVFQTLLTNNDTIRMRQGHRVDVDGLYLTMDWDIGPGKLKSITGYREEEQSFPSTYTGEAFLTLFDSSRQTERETFQQEFRFVSQFDGPFNFTAGASYFKDDFDFNSFFSVGLTSLIPELNPITGTFLDPNGAINLDTRALSDYQLQGTVQKREEYGIYWDGTYEIDEKWSLTAGLRYTHDTKDFKRGVDGGAPCNQFTEARDQIFVDGECRDTRSHFISRAGLTSDQFTGRIPFSYDQFGTRVDDKNTWRQTTFRAVANYNIDAEQMVYLSYATGFLSGGFSETCATVEFCSYDAETNSNLEFGYKGDLFDNKLRLNAALYYMRYDDLQRAAVANYTAADGTAQQETVTVNSGDSEIWGLDLEATWVPTDRLRITSALNLMDHEYKTAVIPALRGTGEPIDLTQFDVPFSPKVKAMLSVDYQIPVQVGFITLSGSANYQSKAETDVFNGVNTQMESRTLVDLGITLEDRDMRWSVSGFVANALDETYRVAALPVAGLWNFTHYGAPRSFGVRLRYSFAPR